MEFIVNVKFVAEVLSVTVIILLICFVCGRCVLAGFAWLGDVLTMCSAVLNKISFTVEVGIVL